MDYSHDARESTNVEDRRPTATWLSRVFPFMLPDSPQPEPAIPQEKQYKQDAELCKKIGICVPDNFDPSIFQKQSDDMKKLFPESAPNQLLMPRIDMYDSKKTTGSVENKL